MKLFYLCFFGKEKQKNVSAFKCFKTRTYVLSRRRLWSDSESELLCRRLLFSRDLLRFRLLFLRGLLERLLPITSKLTTTIDNNLNKARIAILL